MVAAAVAAVAVAASPTAVQCAAVQRRRWRCLQLRGVAAAVIQREPLLLQLRGTALRRHVHNVRGVL